MITLFVAVLDQSVAKLDPLSDSRDEEIDVVFIKCAFQAAEAKPPIRVVLDGQ